MRKIKNLSQKALIFLVFLCSICHTKAQIKVDTLSIKTQLYSIYKLDQRVRTNADSAKYASLIDSANLVQVSRLIDSFGWPGKSFVGPLGNYVIWLVIQHADSATQCKYLPLLEKSVSIGESKPVYVAYLKDRIYMRQGKKQLYGTQVVFNKNTGAQELWPIEDEENVNTRRKSVGLESIEEYAKLFGIDYKITK